MTAEQILVIILATALALFLVLAIVLTTYLIMIAKKINIMADTAEHTVRSFSHFVASLQRSVAPAAITGMVADLIHQFVNRRKKERN